MQDARSFKKWPVATVARYRHSLSNVNDVIEKEDASNAYSNTTPNESVPRLKADLLYHVFKK